MYSSDIEKIADIRLVIVVAEDLDDLIIDCKTTDEGITKELREHGAYLQDWPTFDCEIPADDGIYELNAKLMTSFGDWHITITDCVRLELIRAVGG